VNTSGVGATAKRMGQCGSVPTQRLPLSTLFEIMAKPKPITRSEETLEELLDIVANAREELVSVERRLEQLRRNIAKSRTQKNRSGKS
jgi:hypothetical protein